MYVLSLLGLQAFLWDTESLRKKCTTCDGSRDAHYITDIRFSPIISSRLATSSSDKTVRVWNQNNVSHLFHLFNLVLHCFALYKAALSSLTEFMHAAISTFHFQGAYFTCVVG